MTQLASRVALFCLLVGCSKNPAPTPDAAKPDASAATSSASAAPKAEDGSASASKSEATSGTTVTPEATVAAPAATPPSSDEAPPESFAGGTKETVEGAVGQGCEARSLSGWLELLCRKRNGTGGRPVRAIFPSPAGATEEDAGAAPEVLVDDQRELRVKVPYRDGASQEVTIEWTDTRYLLKVSGASAKLEWAAGGLPLRRACAAVDTESKARITEAQKADAPDRVLPTEGAKLPRFGVCQPAGLGSWAVALRRIAGSGEPNARKLHVDLDAVRVAEDGTRTSAPLGSVEFAPAGFRLLHLQVYDFDDDGNDELIVSYELDGRAPGAAPSNLTPIWTHSKTGIAPYKLAPATTPGGVGIEHLDFDMRPDLGDYGPYVAWLDPDCGAKPCPKRIVGPRFFWHSLPDGNFSRTDAAAVAAIKRACPKAPEQIVVATGGALNTTQTAKNLVCARVWGASAESVTSSLAASRATLCVGAVSCALETTFTEWAKAEPPVTVGGATRAAATGTAATGTAAAAAVAK